MRLKMRSNKLLPKARQASSQVIIPSLSDSALFAPDLNQLIRKPRTIKPMETLTMVPNTPLFDCDAMLVSSLAGGLAGFYRVGGVCPWGGVPWLREGSPSASQAVSRFASLYLVPQGRCVNIPSTRGVSSHPRLLR